MEIPPAPVLPLYSKSVRNPLNRVSMKRNIRYDVRGSTCKSDGTHDMPCCAMWQPPQIPGSVTDLFLFLALVVRGDSRARLMTEGAKEKELCTDRGRGIPVPYPPMMVLTAWQLGGYP